MKKAIGILRNNFFEEPTTMTIYYNGPGKPMTAESSKTSDDLEYCAKDEADARDAARIMYSVWPWEYEELE